MMRIFILLILFSVLLCSLSAKAELSPYDEIIKAVRESKCELVERLLVSGVSPNTKFTVYRRTEQMPLIYMALSHNDICTVNALIASGADVNYISEMNSGGPIWIKEASPLSFAINVAYRTKSLEMVELLLKNGARSDLKASDGVTHVQHILNNWHDAGAVSELEAKNIIKEVKRIIARYKRH